MNSGTHISVFNGVTTLVHQSIDLREIMGALRSSDHDTLVMPLGDVLLLWGNDVNIVEDYDSNRFIDYAVESIQPLRKALAA